MIKNIVFDFGGVIADISREQAVKAFIRLGVKDADRILDKYHQTGIFQELEEGSLTEEAYRNELGKLCGRFFKNKPFHRKKIIEVIILYPCNKL